MKTFVLARAGVSQIKRSRGAEHEWFPLARWNRI